MQTKLSMAPALAIVAIVVYAGSVGATSPSGLTATNLAKGVFEEIDVKTHDAHPHRVKISTKGVSDLHVVRNTLAPGGQTGWHTHPGPSLITVTKGSITAYEGTGSTCRRRVYTAPAGFVDPGEGHVHVLRNETAEPAETVAVQFLPNGAERRLDRPDPGAC